MTKRLTPAEKAANKTAKMGAVKSGQSEVTVVDRNGDVVHTYSKREHGAEFLKLAQEFAGKVEGRKLI
ncbi:MAG: alkyl hydroxyperoxide reductase E [Podoviridae sp. ctviO18]|nr:MAG: alkyl hydroxyperoxide reductase E [Podoviridae sp. ctviO18]